MAQKAGRVTEGEILAELRAKGLASVAEAAAVIPETGGDLSVLQHTTTDAQLALQDVPMTAHAGEKSSFWWRSGA